ncbi:hypothetical protein LZ554_002458 [Drepanopeziza brunnea f. sp. 'monogermtubi']|nr:hypothetical protein LZ554_002458 [Drepanopeziza brunnea f. sp. 'monogermtubi']
MSGQNPLTPPNGTAAAAGALYSTHQAPGTPVSMGLEGPEERSDMAERQESYPLSDEDYDMSDGGAALTMTLSHAEALNNEMDLLDAEVMGHDNLVGLSGHESYYPESPALPDHYPDDEPPDWTHGAEHIYTQQILAGPTSIPAAMSDLSQQLQHLQEGQDHSDIAGVADDIHGAIHQLDHSTPSILLPIFSNLQNGGVTLAEAATQPSFVTMSQVTPSHLSMFQVNPSTLPTAQLPWQAGPGAEITFPTLLAQASSQAQPPFHNPVWDDFDDEDADQPEVDDQFNLGLRHFLENWGRSALRTQNEASRRHSRGPDLLAIREHMLEVLDPVERSDLQGDRCDIQRINWADLGVTPLAARQQRRNTYRNYTNLRPEQGRWHPRVCGSILDDDQNFFKFRRMDFNHDVNLSHFQLRNLIACASRDHIFYAGRGQVMHWNPRSSSAEPDVAMDLRNPTVQPANFISGAPNGIQISSLAIGHDILVAGGFAGEYALVNLRSQKDTKHTEGLVTDSSQSITNFIQVHSARRSHGPLAAFCPNDNSMRILDISTNKFIADHRYEHAINCTAISPDQRLRVVVGDTKQVMICNAETGEILQSLDGHRDFGFSCDWADDGWTVATGNQDMQVKIWDARKWTNSQGLGQPIATIAADTACVRKLKFSPLGSGKRVLLAAEPADIISVIDGGSFSSKQTLTFFGEIGGVDFTNDGQDIFVANCDDMRGGLLQYERCGLASHGRYGLEEAYDLKRKSRNRRRGEGHDWKGTDEEVVRHHKAKGTETQRIRRAAKLGFAMGHF